MKTLAVQLNAQDFDIILTALDDQLRACKTSAEQQAHGNELDLFLRLLARADELNAQVWYDVEVPAWALEHLRKAAEKATKVPALEEELKEVKAVVNSLRQKQRSHKAPAKPAKAAPGKARTSGGASGAGSRKRSAPTAVASLPAPGAAAEAGPLPELSAPTSTGPLGGDTGA